MVKIADSVISYLVDAFMLLSTLPMNKVANRSHQFREKIKTFLPVFIGCKLLEIASMVP